MNGTEGLSAEERAGLRKIAEAATPGRWAVYREDPEDGWVDTYVVEHTFETAIGQCPECGVRASIPEPDAEHIAAFDPPTAIALLTLLAALTAERDRVEALADEWEARAVGSAQSAAAREGLSDAHQLTDYSDMMHRRSVELRAALHPTDGAS